MNSLFSEEPAAVVRERERTLRFALPLSVLIYVSGALVILNGPQAPSLDPYAFLGGAVAMIALWVGKRMGRVSSGVAQVVLTAVAAVLPTLHIASLFIGSTYHDPQVSLLNVTYAFIPILFMLFPLLLPYPGSLWSGVAAWLAIAGGTTFFTVPYWGQLPAREGLLPVLMLVWVGYPSMLTLVIGMARRHDRMLQTYAAKARAAERANADAERSALKFRSIFNQAAVGIALVDARGHWLSVNQRVCDITGYSAAELARTDFQSITHPDDLGADVTLADKVMNHEIDRYSMEKRYLRKDGSIVWVNLSVARIDGAKGEEDRYVTVIEDISQRKTAEGDLARLHGELERRVAERTTALQRSSERWQQHNSTLSVTSELIGFLLSARDEAEACGIAATYLPRILPGTSGVLWLVAEGEAFTSAANWGTPIGQASVSRSGCWAVRRSVAHLAHGQHSLRCSHHAHGADVSSVCEPLIVGGRTIGVLSVEWPGATADTDLVMVNTVAEQLAAALSNIRLRAELHALAVRDPLTGLHNRRSLNEHLPRAIANARRARTNVSVLLADVDHFKQFNDRFGHDAGDRVLSAVAGAMARSLREGDLAFRFGGEEFVAVLADCGPEDAMRWAERLRAAIAEASALADPEGKMPRITCSVGVASFPADGATANQLLDAADRALYAAKDAGRNCVRLLRAA